MKAQDPRVIDFLNNILKNELTAINQYFLHAKMLEDWGFEKLAKKESLNVILILELGSNSMRKGIHDEKLIEIMQDQKTYTINASQDQLEKFSHLSKELNLDLVKQITSKPTEKHIILMCGNRNFSGFQKSILDALI